MSIGDHLFEMTTSWECYWVSTSWHRLLAAIVDHGLSAMIFKQLLVAIGSRLRPIRWELK
jgi:hypothetical protein